MLKIKEEFKNLIPALTSEEYKQLEENCMSQGIREKILTWQGYIIDGHNRYNIAMQWGLEYETESMYFEDESDVKIWMINNQLGRRSVSVRQREYLIGKRYESEKQKHGGQLPKGYDKMSHPLSTAQKLAEEFGITDRQVHRNAEFSKGVDKLNDELRNQVLQGSAQLRKQDIQELAKAEDTFVATSEKEILEKAKELKEKRKEEYKEKLEQRIQKKIEQEPINEEEKAMIDKLLAGETIVINMNKHFHVLKIAKEKGLYYQIDRYSPFGNPYFLDSDGDRNQVCDGFADYFKHKRSLHDKLKDLKGKALGCHCAPLRCHGDHLKELADAN